VKQATKPFEVIYVTAFMNETVQDGDVVTYLALDTNLNPKYIF
jgi:hypothetical protein